MKTVIQVYKIGYNNVVTDDNQNFHGIGDFFRSTLGIYNLSKIYNFNLIVDFSLHPIQNFLEYNEHEYTNIVKEKQNSLSLICESESIMNFINNSSEEVIIFFGWLGPDTYNSPVTIDSQTFIKNLLKPNKIMSEYIETQLNKIPFKEYNILHYRLGDNTLVRNKKTQHSLDHILSNYEPNDILICDSSEFKNQVKNSSLDIFMFNDNICHLGVSNDYNSIQHTLFEFLLISKASKIKSYSSYGWISGFSHIISFIYNIPITSEININLETKIIKNKTIFTSFGNQSYYKSLNRIRNEAESFNIFDNIVIYNDENLKNDFPEFWSTHENFINNNSRGYGYWIWKSFLVLKTLESMNENDILVYADAGCELNNNGINQLKEYFEIVNNSNYGILSFELIYPEKEWTKMDLFNELCMNTYEHLNSIQLMATSFILKKCDHTMKLVNEWYKYSSIYHLIDDSESNLKNDDMFCEHRHDQSIFSLIRKKYGTEIMVNEVDGYNDFSPIKAKRIKE
jgi:hypothetical protein